MTFAQNIATWNSFEPPGERVLVKNPGESISLKHKKRYFTDSGSPVRHRVGRRSPISPHLTSTIYVRRTEVFGSTGESIVIIILPISWWAGATVTLQIVL